MIAAVETAKVRFLRPFRTYKSGQIVTVTKGVARSLQLARLAVVVQETQLELAVAPESASLETAVALAAKAPRRRRAIT